MAVKKKAPAPPSSLAPDPTAAIVLLPEEVAFLSEVHPNSYNPFSQPPEQFELLVRSILEEGFTDPILVNRESKEIINGEHRYTALLVATKLRQEGGPVTADRILALRPQRDALLAELGAGTSIKVVYTNMTRAQLRIATLRRNRGHGVEDPRLTAQVYRDLEALGALEDATAALLLTPEDLQLLDYAPELLPGDAANGRSTSDTPNNVWGDAADGTPADLPSSTGARPRPDLGGYKLNLMFVGDEARVVRAVLGDAPAQEIVRLCQEKLAAAQIPYPPAALDPLPSA